MNARLDALLRHPLLWRAQKLNSQISSATLGGSKLTTGFPELDKCLPDAGWPAQGLIEILVAHSTDRSIGQAASQGEPLKLLLPLLVQLFHRDEVDRNNKDADPTALSAALSARSAQGRCTKTLGGLKAPHSGALAWIAPPLEVFPAALEAVGIDMERVLVIRTDQILWAMEQSLQSAACRAVIAWMGEAAMKNLRRLQLAAETTASLGILIRPLQCAAQSSPAILRLGVECEAMQLKVTVIKSRGGSPGTVLLTDAQD